MQPQIGYEFFGRIILWRNVTLLEFFAATRSGITAPGIELSDDELISVFEGGLIQRDARTGRYYRAR
jgi:hypothetical protein